MPTALEPLLPVLAPIAIVAWIAIVLAGIAHVSGWARLAERFRTERPRPETKRLTSAQLRFMMSYNNCLYLGWDEEGLHLSLLFLFRVGHPPLFIPWSEVEVLRRDAGLLIKRAELRVGGDIPLSLPERALTGVPLPDPR